jgi:hypothetical protein
MMSRNSFHIPHQDIPVGPHFIIALLPYLACIFTANCYISQQMHNNPQKECLQQSYFKPEHENNIKFIVKALYLQCAAAG